MDSLAEARKVKPVRKRLVADLADLPLEHVDNVEGMTWGTRLASGERSLVTQVIALAVE